MEEVFAFLFNYHPFFFRKGEFTFQWGLPFWQILIGAGIVGSALFLIYRRRWLSAPGGPGWSLLALRLAFFSLLLLLLMRPSLVLSTLVPKESLLAVVVDNSRSLSIPEDGRPRGEPAARLLAEDSDFLKRLEEKFYLRFYRFDAAAERVEQPLEVDWQGIQTNLVTALERVLAETKNLPLGGVVLFTDGSDNSYRDFKEVLGEAKARQIPVHTVGLGPETLERDVELVQVSVPRVILPETLSTARITFRQQGFGGSRGQLEVRDGTSLVASREVYFPRDSETVTLDVHLMPQGEGLRTYRFSLQPLEGEQIAENNTRLALVQVRNVRPRILYVEGHPRWEFKFIRQALTEDRHLRLETLLRTALNKFYRQGIEEETILAAGFPSDREELFAYQGLIFGSLESSFFTYGQMEMVRDFVGRRGGGFLMLGGTLAFGSGGYQNTPIEEILPVWLDESASPLSSGDLYARGEGKVALTERGLRHPALQLSLDEEKNLEKWEALPTLTDWNRVSGTKSGATVLAHVGSSARNPAESPLLVFQRYGRGQTLALLTGSSWRWQMLLDHQDETHETFWRQLLRWLVSTARDPVTVETEREIYSQNEPVQIRAEINDKAFNRINDARVEAVVTSPSGATQRLPLQWSGREEGIYVGQWIPHEDGLFRVEVQAQSRSARGDTDYGRASTHFLTSTGTREFFEAYQKKDFLQKLSEETGGNYYSLATVRRLPDEIIYTESHSSVVEVLDLWDMPFNFLLLLGFLIGEWVLRKRHGSI